MDFFQTNLGIFLTVLGQTLLVLGFVMISLLLLVYGDRKIWGAVQMRRGPNVVGPWGILQTIADALKYVVKEVVVPAGADKTVFFLAPLVSFILAAIAWAVIPFNGRWILADLNEPVEIIIPMIMKPIETSYEIIWAAERNEPRNGYLELEAQPPIITP